jgi:UPF0271 protein
MLKRLDLNADVGEGLATDEALLSIVTSANIACGAHAGDEASMRRTVRLCLEGGVGIGAHPGYADKDNFGRLAMNLPASEVTALVEEQVRKLSEIASREGGCLSHVKPHGALSNQAMDDWDLALAVAQGVFKVSPNLIFLAPSGTALEEAGKRLGLPVALEIFADRAYDERGRLVPRKQAGAVLHDPEIIAGRILDWLGSGRIETIIGLPIALSAQSVCVHGDTLEAVEIAALLRNRLQAAGVEIKPL